MPSTARRRAAVAVVDAQLADWAHTRQLDVSPERIRGWRRAGLLPAPTLPTTRPHGAPAGRLSRQYSDADLETAQRIVNFLAAHAHPGRPATDLAILQFAAGLPVPHPIVVAGLQAQATRIRQKFSELLAQARAYEGDVPIEMALSRTYEQAEALAKMALTTRSEISRTIRRQLRRGKQPAADIDVLPVLVGVFSTVLGEAPPPDDAELLEAMLYGFGAHGLVESAGSGVAPIVAMGPGRLSEGLRLAVQAKLLDPPLDPTESELSSALQFARSLGVALAAIPDSHLRHLLGGDSVAGFWKPDDPQAVFQLLVWVVKLRRLGVPLDPDPIINAIRHQGWLPTSAT